MSLNSRLDKIAEQLGVAVAKPALDWSEMTTDEKLDFIRKTDFVLGQFEAEGKPIPDVFTPFMEARARWQAEDDARRARFGLGYVPAGGHGGSSELMSQLGSPPPHPPRRPAVHPTLDVKPDGYFSEEANREIAQNKIERELKPAVPTVIGGGKRWLH